MVLIPRTGLDAERFESAPSSLSKHTPMTHEINTWQDWKFGLITREVYRISENQFEINDLSDGWSIAIVDLTTMQGLLNGSVPLTSIQFS